MSYTDNWNDDWRDELKSDHYDCWERLCDCRNLRRDLMVMAKLMKKYNLGKDPQDVLDRILEWVTDWNSQVNLYPDDEEYDQMLKQLREN